MSDKPKTFEREKFKISLAEYLRSGLSPQDYALSRAKDQHPASSSVASNSGKAESELTPQQKARKRYEERIMITEIRKSGWKKLENAWLKHEQDVGHPIQKGTVIDRSATRNITAEHIVKNAATVRIVVAQSVTLRSGDRDLLPTIVNVEMVVFSVLKTILLSS
ncbi:hypothetical protein EV361DRAFT_955515 [Lentinula raphanica]|nr:hypothetical protein EV361DRAFT_955515 [Lentinula raphanica]